MGLLTIDSSVIVASLLAGESRHHEALDIWKTVLEGENRAVMPWTVLVEVVAAVRRRTGSEKHARAVASQLRRLETLAFVSLDERSALAAAVLAGKTGLRGMDAVVV